MIKQIMNLKNILVIKIYKKVGNAQSIFIDLDFKLDDGKKGVIYLIADFSVVGSIIHSFVNDMMKGIIIIILITNGILTFFMSKNY